MFAVFIWSPVGISGPRLVFPSERVTEAAVGLPEQTCRYPEGGSEPSTLDHRPLGDLERHRFFRVVREAASVKPVWKQLRSRRCRDAAVVLTWLPIRTPWGPGPRDLDRVLHVQV